MAGDRSRRPAAAERSGFSAVRLGGVVLLAGPVERRAEQRSLVGGSGTGFLAMVWICIAGGRDCHRPRSGEYAFITSLNVVFVPVLAASGGRHVSPRVWVAAALALLGTALLCNDGVRPNAGDVWTLVTAGTYAVYIIRLERFTARFPSMPLTATQLWAVAVLSAVWAGADIGFRSGHEAGWGGAAAAGFFACSNMG